MKYFVTSLIRLSKSASFSEGKLVSSNCSLRERNTAVVKPRPGREGRGRRNIPIFISSRSGFDAADYQWLESSKDPEGKKNSWGSSYTSAFGERTGRKKWSPREAKGGYPAHIPLLCFLTSRTA